MYSINYKNDFVAVAATKLYFTDAAADNRAVVGIAFERMSFYYLQVLENNLAAAIQNLLL